MKEKLLNKSTVKTNTHIVVAGEFGPATIDTDEMELAVNKVITEMEALGYDLYDLQLDKSLNGTMFIPVLIFKAKIK